MPIPQLQKKQPRPEYRRDPSHIRRQRAVLRQNTTKHQKSAKRPQPKWQRRLLKAGVILIFGGGLACIIAVSIAYGWVSKDLASIEDVSKRAVSESTKIYSRDEQTLLYEIGDNKRTDIDLIAIDKKIQWATIALEDRDFYQHPGFKITSILRAVLKNITRGGNIQGASTLTQQLIKNAVLSSEKTYNRKLKELILAVRLERKYNKDEILEMYLNEIYYGANYQGVETAAREYLHKSASEVTLAEAATLASLPKDPVDLPRDPQRLKARRDYTLDLMIEQGYVIKEEVENAKKEELNITSESIASIKAPHFVFYVSSILEKQYGQNAVRKGGMKVITTLDWDRQQKAEQAVSEGMEKVERYGGTNAALVSLDNHTGQVLAMVGSHDFFDKDHAGQVNVATSLRQPGSSIKPVVYLSAFEIGYTPETKLYDVVTDFPTAVGMYRPHNYDLSESGPVTLREALGRSLNIPAVKLLYLVGINKALDMAERLGYTSFNDRSRFGLSFVLGGAEVTLLEHTAAFATYAREGDYHKPSSVLKIYDKKGSVIQQWSDSVRQVVDPQVVRILNNILSDPGPRGSVFALLNLSQRPVAAKTGTTTDYRDAWAMGYTPSMTTGVWVGNSDGKPMGRGAAGIVIAAPIWRKYMESALDSSPTETFKSPSYKAATEVLDGKIEELKKIPVDATTGEHIPNECLTSYPVKYITYKDYKETHTILHYLNKDDPKGSTPQNPRNDPMYEPWETAVVRWTKTQEGYLTEDLPKVSCDYRSNDQQPIVIIDSFPAKTATKQDFPILVSVTAGKERVLVRVLFIIDEISVEEKTNLNISSTKILRSGYKPINLTKGKHTVIVRAYDERGNVGEAAKTFEFTAE